MVVCEKDALSNIPSAVTWEYGVPLVPVSGFCAGFIHQVARRHIDPIDPEIPLVLYYLGDYDPAGTHLMRDVEAKFRRYPPAATIDFVQLALNREQVDRYELPTRPTKRLGNLHAKNFEDDESVELDALPIDILQDMVRTAIESHIDWELWREAEQEQAKDKAVLRKLKQLRTVKSRKQEGNQ